MSEHPGSRACYVRGCRALECRVANAVYEKLRRARRRQGPGVVNGRETSRMLTSLTSEGYPKGRLADLLGLSRWTLQDHWRSSPVRTSTFQRVQAFWRQTQADHELEPSRRKVVETMLNSLARDWQSEARTWQNIRPADDDV